MANITINPQSIRIDNEIYPLANIARVHTYVLVPRKWVGVLVGILLILPGIIGGINLSGPATIVPILVMLIGLLILVLTLARRRRYVLALETAGPPYATLWSRDRNAVAGLLETFQQVIENPPDQPTVINIGDIVHGDKADNRGAVIGKQVVGG